MLITALLVVSGLVFGQTNGEAKLAYGDDIYLTFKLSDKVTMQPVQYKNRFGISIAAHLYLPKDIDKSKKYAALSKEYRGNIK